MILLLGEDQEDHIQAIAEHCVYMDLLKINCEIIHKLFDFYNTAGSVVYKYAYVQSKS